MCSVLLGKKVIRNELLFFIDALESFGRRQSTVILDFCHIHLHVGSFGHSCE